MKTLESFINKVQTNRPINAVKTAIIKIAYINIGVAFFIFAAYILNYKDHILSQSLYQMYCLAIGLGMSYVISDELSNDKQDHYKMITLLINSGLALVFIRNSDLVSFPLLTLVSSLIIHYVMVFTDRMALKSEHLPTAVLDYLNRIIPVMAILTLGLLVILNPYILTAFSNTLDFLTSIVATLPFTLLVIASVCSFWILGIHGVGVIGTLVRPFWLHMMIVNGALVLAGQSPRFIGSETFLQWIVWIGGSGATIGLSILLRYFSKSQSMKTLGKDAFVSNIFNINENIIFGVPIVDNKHFRIPFFLAPILSALIGYTAFIMGWVRIPSIVAPWVIPAPLGVFISTLGDFRAVILVFALIAVSTLVYLPFFIKHDKEERLKEYN